MTPFTSLRLHDCMRSAMQFATALLFAAACSGPAQSPDPRPSPLQRLATQPLDQPPATTDSVWAAVTAPENVIDDGEGGRWVRNALYVGFVEGVPLARRQQLVDSVQGRPVGGTTLGSTALYLLVFEHLRPAARDVALDALFSLTDGLRAHPDVKSVITIELTPMFGPHDGMRAGMSLVTAVSFVAACRGPAASPGQAPSPQQRLANQPLDQPPVTTDRVWAAVTAPENIVQGEVGRWVCNALYVAFREGVPLARREQLVDSVQARAVGGYTMGSTPFYLLIFEHLRSAPRDRALDALFKLADGLESHRDVRAVRTIDLTPLGH